MKIKTYVRSIMLCFTMNAYCSSKAVSSKVQSCIYLQTNSGNDDDDNTNSNSFQFLLFELHFIFTIPRIYTLIISSISLEIHIRPLRNDRITCWHEWNCKIKKIHTRECYNRASSFFSFAHTISVNSNRTIHILHRMIEIGI